jgi:hypothetical protein
MTDTMEKEKINLYDQILLGDQRKVEVIQMFGDGEYLLQPLEGGMPRRESLKDSYEILSSIFSEVIATTSLERMQNLLAEAEKRWEQHSTKSPVGKKRGEKKDTISFVVDF